MRAIVLAGGEGTRLRPLTRRTPKPLMPLLNRPLLEHLLLSLRAHGIDRVTLALTHVGDAIPAALGDGARLGLALEYAYEERPLGSGGAIASIAGAWRAEGWSDTFVVCNGDIVGDLDLSAMLAAHRARGAELSMALHEVDDPSPYGVVELDEGGRIRRFVEKPAREAAPSRLINAGTWIFEPGVVNELDATRFNRVEESLFPALAAAGRGIYGVHQPDTHWADVGDAATLLRVNLQLARALGGGAAIVEGARIDATAAIEPPCVIGAGATIERDACVAESLLWDGVHVGAGATVRRSILASGVRVGAGAVVEDAVIAHEVDVSPGLRVTGIIEPTVPIAGGATEGRSHG